MSVELGSVVEPQERRRTAPEDREPVQDGDDVVGVDGPVDVDREGFAGELVDHVQHLQGAAVGGDVELEVQRPQGVRGDQDIAPTWVPIPVSRFLWRFTGTRRPSSRHSRRTRLSLTCQPALRAALAARRQPHRGRRVAKLRRNSRNRRSSSEIGGGPSRWVERC